MTQGKLAILVLSYDGRRDLWRPFFSEFFRHWGDCPYTVYLLTNELDFSYAGVTTVKSGKRDSWADSVRKGLAQIKEEYVLVLLEDYFLLGRVNNQQIAEAFDYMLAQNAQSMNLIPVPKGMNKLAGTKNYREISHKQAYCVTFGYHIMSTEFFGHLCKEDYTPWAFENYNSFDANEQGRLPGKILTVTKSLLPCWGEGILDKGMMTRKAYRHCCREHIDIDYTNIQVMSVAKSWKLKLKMMISGLIPSTLKMKLKKTLQRSDKK